MGLLVIVCPCSLHNAPRRPTIVAVSVLQSSRRTNLQIASLHCSNVERGDGGSWYMLNHRPKQQQLSCFSLWWEFELIDLLFRLLAVQDCCVCVAVYTSPPPLLWSRLQLLYLRPTTESSREQRIVPIMRFHLTAASWSVVKGLFRQDRRARVVCSDLLLCDICGIGNYCCGTSLIFVCSFGFDDYIIINALCMEEIRGLEVYYKSARMEV